MTDLPTLRIISLGAGVQSTTMLLMACEGLLTPRPDYAIFADTQWEPPSVYEHLARLERISTIPIHRVSAGSVKRAVLDNISGGFVPVPFFTKGKGMGRRQCTRQFKIAPIAQHIRQLLGVAPRKHVPRGTVVEVWIGISTDEIFRMKPSRYKWQRNVWPLVDKGMSRKDCLRWLTDRGYPLPPKSACIGCPYHDNAHWQRIKEADTPEWREAVEIDRLLRKPGRTPQYIHYSRRPLDEADFGTPSPDHFINECEGMCGV